MSSLLSRQWQIRSEVAGVAGVGAVDLERRQIGIGDAENGVVARQVHRKLRWCIRPERDPRASLADVRKSEVLRPGDRILVVKSDAVVAPSTSSSTRFGMLFTVTAAKLSWVRTLVRPVAPEASSIVAPNFSVFAFERSILGMPLDVQPVRFAAAADNFKRRVFPGVHQGGRPGLKSGTARPACNHVRRRENSVVLGRLKRGRHIKACSEKKGQPLPEEQSGIACGVRRVDLLQCGIARCIRLVDSLKDSHFALIGGIAHRRRIKRGLPVATRASEIAILF